MKKVCIVTTTRADYGLLYPLIKRMSEDDFFEVQILVSGTHLNRNFGYTKNEIISDGFKNLVDVPILSRSLSPNKIFEKTVSKFTKQLKKSNPDLVIVLGDRYEILAVASVCLLLNIPLAHLSGGDITLGAIDDACRHAITKLSNLHFTGNEDMKNRVIQMGEQPNTVFNVGELGIENILKDEIMSFEDLKKSINFDLEEKRYVVATYHPETLSNISALEQVKIFVEYIKANPQYKYIITKANVDNGGDEINQYIKNSIKNCPNIIFIDSLGRRRYLSAVKHSAFVLGNSSSGIVEVPYLKVPTINIGNRQEGRMQTKSIINTRLNLEDIDKAVKKCQDQQFISKCVNIDQNLYGDGNTSGKITDMLKFFLKTTIDKKKIFYNLGDIK